MKVVQLTKTFFPETVGGIEEAVRQNALASRQAGIENEVLTLCQSREEMSYEYEGIKVHAFPVTLSFHSCPLSIQMWRKIKVHLETADVIHCHFPWPFLDLIFLLKAIKKPLLITYHCDAVSPRQKLFEWIYRPLCASFLARASKIVATSPNIIKSSAMLRRFSNKVQCIPSALSFPEAQPAEENVKKLLEQYGDYALFLGVLRHYKGLETLLMAASQVRGNILIAGSGPMRERLEALIKDEGLNNVHLMGRVTEQEKLDLIAGSKMVVLPSTLRSEAFGLTLLEGAMHSKPLISTELGTGTSYVNLDGETGWVVAPGDVEALQLKMNDLFENTARAQAFGLKAYERFSACFEVSQVISAYIDLYKRLAEAS